MCNCIDFVFIRFLFSFFFLLFFFNFWGEGVWCTSTCVCARDTSHLIIADFLLYRLLVKNLNCRRWSRSFRTAKGLFSWLWKKRKERNKNHNHILVTHFKFYKNLIIWKIIIIDSSFHLVSCKMQWFKSSNIGNCDIRSSCKYFWFWRIFNNK